jgi:hypothetical protein
MIKNQVTWIAFSSSWAILVVLIVSILLIMPVTAASSRLAHSIRLGQTTPGFQYLGVSALAFMPVNGQALYHKDLNQQLLSLEGASRDFTGDVNRFVAPLTLPNQFRLIGLTVFGQDFDQAGEIWLRVKRCQHSQAQCVSLAETTSELVYDAGPFEKVSTFNELIDNSQFTYLLELEMTALGNSGLRSIRLELIEEAAVSIPANTMQHWSLADLSTSFPISMGTVKRLVRICTDDLSHLPNITHYPILVVDGVTQSLPSKVCVDASGYNIELRRNLSAGSSSGTYQFLQ